MKRATNSSMAYIPCCSIVLMCYNLEIESTTLHPTKQGDRNNKINKMNNMNTTLEIPEGSKAVISGKVIDGVADAVNDCLCRECDCGGVG